MASDKKRRKAARAKQKTQHPAAGPFRHPDGDRRHRAAMARAVKEVKVKEKFEKLIGAVDLPEEDPD